MEIAPAHPIFAALSRTRTALNGTMTPVPAGHTQAGAVLALAMHLTPEWIGSKLTQDYFSPPLIFSKSFLCSCFFPLVNRLPQKIISHNVPSPNSHCCIYCSCFRLTSDHTACSGTARPPSRPHRRRLHSDSCRAPHSWGCTVWYCSPCRPSQVHRNMRVLKRPECRGMSNQGGTAWLLGQPEGEWVRAMLEDGCVSEQNLGVNN